MVSGTLRRLGWLALANALSLACAEAPSDAGPGAPAVSQLPVPVAQTPRAAAEPAGDSQAWIEAQCRGCHAPVKVDSLPRSQWRALIGHMERVRGQRRPDTAPFDVERVTRWFEAGAPERLSYPEPLALGGGAVSFVRAEPIPGPSAPGVLHLALESRDGRARALWLSDLWSSSVYRYDLARRRFTRLATLHKPGRLELGDLDADGRLDAVVADMGALLPVNTQQGQVIWLRSRGARFEPVPLLQHVGRVADVALGDLDADGDLDVVAAVFGSHAPGVVMLSQLGRHSGRFEARTLDVRDGSVDVELTDLDADGRLDVVAALSQEHEAVVAYLQRQPGVFETVTLAKIDDPGWGSMGIALGDVDGDADTDVLWVNGDVMDTFSVRPQHGLHLLRNQGGLRFEREALGSMPGAARAALADLDADGDLDVAVASCLPPASLLLQPVHGPTSTVSLAWFEQQPDARFIAHGLERDHASHTSVLPADLDGDGQLDLLVSELLADPASDPGSAGTQPGSVAGSPGPWFTVYRGLPKR
jgi:hypothetical protein